MRTIALVSYNQILSYPQKIHFVDDFKIIVFSNTFGSPFKSPKAVVDTDPNYQEILSYYGDLEQVIIFAGKKSSGALEIISLFCSSFANKRDCLNFVICHHDRKRKADLLHFYGIRESQILTFRDGNEQCMESWLLKARAEAFMHANALV